jgi:hypothetical protein
MGLTLRRKVPTSCAALGWANRIGAAVNVYHWAHRDDALCAVLDATRCSDR